MMINGREYTASVNGNAIRHTPVTHAADPVRVFYTLYEKKCDGRYIPIRSVAYPSARMALRVFADSIASAPLTYSIRPVKVKSDAAQGMSHFRAVTWNEWRDSPMRERYGKRKKHTTDMPDWKKKQANDKD
jgi:hypothetical protein